MLSVFFESGFTETFGGWKGSGWVGIVMVFGGRKDELEIGNDAVAGERRAAFIGDCLTFELRVKGGVSWAWVMLGGLLSR